MPTREELISLVVEPAESLSIEHKSWLDITEREAQATLAKAAIALANHGGGIIVLGMRGDDAAAGLESQPRPEHINRYRQDDINAAVNRFADPQLHCGLQFGRHPQSEVEHAFVIVPAGERVPVMSRRDCVGIINAQRCYIRKPGPRSEEPFTAAEWRALLDRCVRAGRDDLLDAIRLIVEGRAGEAPNQAALEVLAAFSDACLARWEALTDPLPPQDAGRMPHGRYELTFEIDDAPPAPSLATLRQRLASAGEIKHTGWGPFVTLHRPELAPRVVDGTIEAWLGVPDAERFQRTPAHCDFWRATPRGQLFLLRGYDEDMSDRAQPGDSFDITLPVWRVGEAMLFVARLARQFDENPLVRVRCRYLGLHGRVLRSLHGRRALFDNRHAFDDEVTLQAEASAEELEENLAEVLHPMLMPLYERFDFFELPRLLVTEELAAMRGNRF